MKSTHRATSLTHREGGDRTSSELPKMVRRVMLHRLGDRKGKGGGRFDQQTGAVAAQTFAGPAA